MTQEIKSNVVYRNKVTGNLGVLLAGYDYGCLGDDEVGIVYRGDDNKPEEFSSFFVGTNPSNLEEYKLKPEDQLTKKHIGGVCMLGKGDSCCRYLTAGSRGFSCARVDGNTSIAHHIDDRIRNGTINAKGSNCGGRYTP